MCKRFNIKWIIICITVSSISCHKITGNFAKFTEQDNVISDFFHYYFNISIRIKLLWQLFYSIVGSILVGLSGILPLFFISSETGSYLRSQSGVTSLNRWLSFAFGSIIGDVFLHLLPEAWENAEDGGSGAHSVLAVWTIVGFLSFFAVEKLFVEGDADTDGIVKKSTQSRKHEMKQRPNGRRTRNTGCPAPLANGKVAVQRHESGIKTEGYLNLMANFTDNFTHGLAIGGSFLISFKIGALTTICILIHEIPHEVSDFVILLRAGFDRWKAAKCQLFTAAGSILGSVFALTADAATTGLSKTCILPFTSGAFIYIAMVSLLPSILSETSFRESVVQILLIMIGFVIMVTMSQCCA